MDNQVGSINFDANALYLEEDDEHDYDDKQQDNEIKELISQGGLDAFLDDDSLISSSDESSYDDSDHSDTNHRLKPTNHNNIRPTHQIHHSTKLHEKLIEKTDRLENNDNSAHVDNPIVYSPMSNKNHNLINATPIINIPNNQNYLM